MGVFLLRACFDAAYYIIKAIQLSAFTSRLLQYIFYMLWDLPILVPPLCMHYINYRPQFKVIKEETQTNLETEKADDTDEVLESVTRRPTWLKNLAYDDSINHIDDEFLNRVSNKD